MEPLLKTRQSNKMIKIIFMDTLYPQRGIHYVHSTGSQKATHFVYKPEGCTAFGLTTESSGIRVWRMFNNKITIGIVC